MSLEAAIKELTEAVKANTAALGGKAPAKASTKSDDDDEAPKKPAAGKPGAGKAGGKPSGKKAPTVEDIAKRFGAYLTGKTGTDKKTAAKNVTKIVEHYDVERVSEVDPDEFPALLAMLDKFEAGENPFEDEDGEEDEDEDSSSLM